MTRAKNGIMKIAKEIQDLDNEIKRLEATKSDRIKFLKEHCNHPYQDKKTVYYEGSYLDRSEHHEITFCLICKTELDRKVSYGTFG